MAERSIEWLAGLLEGEACFSARVGKRQGGYLFPKIAITMTDRDIIDEVAALWNKRVHIRKHHAPYKQAYETAIQGVPALNLMLALFPHMSSRRKAKIEEVLTAWEHRKDLRCA